jgi:hypothetical protein
MAGGRLTGPGGLLSIPASGRAAGAGRSDRDSYSRKVPQQVRIRADSHARPGMVTCTDTLRWTCCH